MAIHPTQPQGIGGVLDTSFQLYKASVGSVWPLCLLSSLLASPPSIYMVVTGQEQAASGAQGGAALLGAMMNPTYWLIYAISMVLVSCAIGAIYLKEHAIGSDEQLSLGEALQAALPRALLLFLAGVLYVIAFIVGSVLFLIPGMIVSVSLVLVANLMLFEGKGPIDALVGSHRLVWGNWWRTAAILTVGFILVLVIYMAAGLVMALIVPFIGWGVGDELIYSMVSSLLIGVVMNLLVMPFFVALLIAVYWDLKLRKEGGDLAARVGALSA